MNQELIKEITLKALSDNYEFVKTTDGLSKFIVKKEKFEHILPNEDIHYEFDIEFFDEYIHVFFKLRNFDKDIFNPDYFYAFEKDKDGVYSLNLSKIYGRKKDEEKIKSSILESIKKVIEGNAELISLRTLKHPI